MLLFHILTDRQVPQTTLMFAWVDAFDLATIYVLINISVCAIFRSECAIMEENSFSTTEVQIAIEYIVNMDFSPSISQPKISVLLRDRTKFNTLQVHSHTDIQQKTIKREFRAFVYH